MTIGSVLVDAPLTAKICPCCGREHQRGGYILNLDGSVTEPLCGWCKDLIMATGDGNMIESGGEDE